MFDNIIDNVDKILLKCICPICGKVNTVKFIESQQYVNVSFDDDAVVEYIEAHSSFDELALLDDGDEITIVLHSVLCDSKECKRKQLQKQREELLGSIKLPLLYKDVAIAKSTSVETQGMPGVFYIGKVGAGKTCKAVALLKRAILDAGGPAKCTYKFVNACELFFMLQEEMNSPVRKSLSVLRECMEVDILILDDVGTEKYTDWTTSQLYMLINSRLENLKLTIVTGNLSDENDIATRFSSRLASRFSLYNVIEVRGDDRRKS